MSAGRLALLAAALLVAATPARAEKVILALSDQMVKISSSFTGTGITIFGAIERDEETVSRRSTYDIVVVMRGPAETLVTRRKERLAGIWLNREARTFVDMPSFYALSATRPLFEVTTPQLLKRFQLGVDNLAFGRPEDEAPAADDAAFQQAFLRLKERASLYREEPFAVTFPGQSVFQTMIEVPANVPVGVYQVSAYLFSDSALIATGNAAVGISKTGFEQFSFDLAHENGFLYGLVCLALALTTGWLAGVLFRRD